MKKAVTILALLATLLACQESLEERCRRECAEYTRRHCPQRIDSCTVLDSVTFGTAGPTVSYCYTIGGMADDRRLIDRSNPREHLLQSVRNSTQLKRYKEAGYAFRYVYHSSSHRGSKLYETTFTADDYRQRPR